MNDTDELNEYQALIVSCGSSGHSALYAGAKDAIAHRLEFEIFKVMSLSLGMWLRAFWLG